MAAAFVCVCSRFTSRLLSELNITLVGGESQASATVGQPRVGQGGGGWGWVGVFGAGGWRGGAVWRGWARLLLLKMQIESGRMLIEHATCLPPRIRRGGAGPGGGRALQRLV